MFMRTKPYWTLFGVARGGCPTRRPSPRRGGIRASGRHLTPPLPPCGAGRARAPPARGLAWRRVLLRYRVLRTPAPRRTPGVARLPGRGLGRPGPAVPRGAAGRDAAGRRAGGRGGGRRVPAGRARLHAVGDPGRPLGRFRGSFRPSACRTPSGALGGRALVGPARRGGTGGGRRVVHRGTGGPHRGGGRVGVRPGPAGGHRAGLPPVGQPRGGHRAAGGPDRGTLRRRGRAPPGGRGAVAGLGTRAGRLVAADRQRPQVGRAGRCRAARRAQGGPVRPPRPGRRAGVGTGAGLREHPGDRGGGGLAARGTRRGRGRGGTAARPGGPDPHRGAPAGARRGGGRRSAAATAAPGHLLVSLCRRGDLAPRAGSG